MVQTDPINLEMNIRCDPSISYWCAEFLIYEVDNLPRTNDFIASRKFCTNQTEMKSKYKPFYPGGDLSPNYEFNYVLEHDCVKNGETHCIDEIKNDVYVSVSGQQNVKFDVEAFNGGKLGNCIWYD
ncbi:hypothetical protein CRE_05151 [Caenorhabditis remanei]|uniref:Uncharacterized protein n=2 Tax=Caenorhabditis remanei TaxID=31234 RepID=E3N6C3_CAERE|nr:hypothetical protein CRE_05151 [Caenorhabditis remanei]